MIENSRYEATYSDNVCRICESNNIKLTPIFKDDGVKNQFEMKINKYLPIKVKILNYPGNWFKKTFELVGKIT